MNSVVQTRDGSYAIGGTLIVGDFDHAYVAVLDQTGENILWDNTVILYPSGMAQILVNHAGNMTGGGNGPLYDNQGLIRLAIFNPVESLTAPAPIDVKTSAT